MTRIRVTELARGYWQASIEGEQSSAVVDRAPDQALAGLVRANLRRFGVEAILYDAAESEGLASPEDYSQGETVFPVSTRAAGDRVERG